MKIAVFGDGGWGTALAVMLCEKGNDIYLWSNFPEYAEIVRKKRENIKFLPCIKIPEGIIIGADVEYFNDYLDLAVFAVPSQHMRSVCRKIRIKKAGCILSVAKGIENNSLKRMTEVIEEEIPGIPVAALSGPSHAEEVGKKMPTAVVSVSKDIRHAEYVQKIFMGENFRVYTSTDVIGVELGGALKNVIAIAVGICDGLMLGDNSRAALMTRGIAEIARLGAAMGARRETFTGLSGIGDVIVTCISKYGRNLRFGRMLAEGRTVKDALASTEMVVEGAATSAAAYELGEKYNIEMPICNEVYRIVHEGKSYKQAIKDLMSRAAKKETEW